MTIRGLEKKIWAIRDTIKEMRATTDWSNANIIALEKKIWATEDTLRQLRGEAVAS